MFRGHRVATLVAILLGFVALATVGSSAQDSAPFLGNWKGSVTLGNDGFEIVLHLKLDAKQALTGTIDVPGQDVRGRALGTLVVTGDTISFIVPESPGKTRFSGKLAADGATLTGTMTEGELQATFSVKRLS
jgi:hypothetical protein